MIDMIPDRALGAHDVDSLAAWLATRTGRPLAVAQRAAAKAMRHAFGTIDDERRWNDLELQQTAGIGRWARPALLALSPAAQLSLLEREVSHDGTTRLLWQLHDGELIESVIIPSVRPQQRRSRTTVCLSSQVGCARHCAFCESGRLGLHRQLSSGEIIDQVRGMRRLWAERSCGPVTNVVFMGMGEPLDNLPEVARAIRLLCHPYGFGITPSHVTVSSVGVADRFDEFFRSCRAELAVSLGAPDDERRRQIMPAARRYDLATIRTALAAALPHGRRVLFQYALFAGFNDSPEDADRLADYVEPLRCRVNVITANPGPARHLRTPSLERTRRFTERLHRRGVRTILRASRGGDVGGACGQLAGRYRDGATATPMATPPSHDADETASPTLR